MSDGGPAEHTRPPVVLIVAGSDPLAGAGGVADALTVAEVGAHPLVVTTAFVDQDSRETRGWIETNSVAFEEQFSAALDDGRPDAIKVGMVGSDGRVAQLRDALQRATLRPPVVIDPVLRAGIDDATLGRSGLAGAIVSLSAGLSHDRLVCLTPNVPELATLLGQAVPNDPAALAAAARELHRVTGAAVLAKGGHLATDRGVDILVHDDETTMLSPIAWTATDDLHGTGCCLSSAVAAHLAHGSTLVSAVTAARSILAAKVANALRIGSGRRQLGPLRSDQNPKLTPAPTDQSLTGE